MSFSQRNDQVELAAPGQSVLSTAPGGRYTSMSGTSMATPHVAGVAALLWNNAPTCSAEDVRRAMVVTAKDLGSRGRDNYYGPGLVQSRAAMDYLSTCGVPPPPTPVPTPVDFAALTLQNDGGQTVSAVAGTISDGWATYPDATRRELTVRGAACALRFTSLDVEESEGCEWDRVEVLSMEGASLGRFCGSSLPGEASSTGGVTITLLSDEAAQGSGFDLEFRCEPSTPSPLTPQPTPMPTPVPPTPVPGAQYLTLRADDGTTVAGGFGFLSDGWATYPSETAKSVTLEGNCELRWTSFDLEASSGCEYDHVSVASGGIVDITPCNRQNAAPRTPSPSSPCAISSICLAQ